MCLGIIRFPIFVILGETVMSMFMGAVFNFDEKVHYQHSSGFIDDEHWAKSRFGLKNLVKEERPALIFRN